MGPESARLNLTIIPRYVVVLIRGVLRPCQLKEARPPHASFWHAPLSPSLLYPFPFHTRYASIAHKSAAGMPTINDRTVFCHLAPSFPTAALTPPPLIIHFTNILNRYGSFPAASVSTRSHEPKDCECVCPWTCQIEAVPRRGMLTNTFLNLH